ncbi:MAG: hypothetical protein Q4D81_07420 [Eubacteriales bacterium]|nr:hypothetical protein [Eubacteriales bacterium]
MEKRLDNMIEISKKDAKELCKKEINCVAVILSIILIKGIMIIGSTML